MCLPFDVSLFICIYTYFHIMSFLSVWKSAVDQFFQILYIKLLYLFLFLKHFFHWVESPNLATFIFSFQNLKSLLCFPPTCIVSFEESKLLSPHLCSSVQNVPILYGCRFLSFTSFEQLEYNNALVYFHISCAWVLLRFFKLCVYSFH